MDSADSEVSGVSTRYRGYREEFQKMINTRELDWIDEYNENILFHKNIKNGKVEWGKQWKEMRNFGASTFVQWWRF